MGMLIALVGMPGAGKSEAAGFLRDQLGWAYLRFGDAVEKRVKELGQEVNEANERAVREQFRAELGMKAMAVKIDPLIAELKKTKDKIVLDGLYSWEEYEYLKPIYRDLVLVCIYATPATRYERLSKRPHRPLTVEEARSRDVAELVNLHKGPPIALADFLVINEGALAELHDQLQQVVAAIEKGKYWH